MAFKHFLISRFNLRPKGRDLASQEWMERRWDLFLSTCWPSVKHQSNQNFTWLMFFDVETIEEDRTRIKELEIEYPQFQPIFIRGTESFNDEVVNEVKKKSGIEFSHVITTRLDNDDAIHEAFVQTIQDAFKGQDEALIDLISGYSLWTEELTLLARIDKPFNPFVSLIERNHPGLTTVATRNHDHWATYQNRLVLRREPLWMQVIHGGNQASQFGYKGWLVKGGYLNGDITLLDSFHVDIHYSKSPTIFFIWIYNFRVWVHHLFRRLKFLLKKLSGRK